ncbi:tail chaperonin [Xanthomonas phage Langgrundblatt2]|jgi:hypothetical protein|uniref:Tail chaperonin n=2 Tax=Shirevirus TaxID=3153128 RepID=A0A9E7E1H6_9CAUD|nr:hypothetical protein QAY89_gp39 [Xanthomonas phage Langgrundblatt1]YP_010742922.1 tail chaperonin [Xanthomonas phage Langgrundblatt2]URA06804.1 hypothetical protein Langgrundblatt1_BL10039 [Xanthomonas phage Langgrundblatt1]URA06873.1 tail chaperonin [Xanthomonas phage Langgrundblatt2]
MGPHEQTIAKQAIRAGQPIPARIANAPELHIGLELFINAFFDLDTERQAGYSIGPIPWSKIKEYAFAYSFDADLTEDLFYFVKALDNAHMKRLESEMKAKQKVK